MRKFGAIILSLGLTTPVSAADYLCDSFEVAFEFYRSNVALDEFEVAGWRAQPFILRDFPVAPYIETAEEEYDLINVADANSALKKCVRTANQSGIQSQRSQLHNPEPVLIALDDPTSFEPPHLTWSTAMFRKRRTENGEQDVA